MADRRRINGPPGGTNPPIFTATLNASARSKLQRPERTRQADELRKTFLRTGVTPSASGSAYLELEAPTKPKSSDTSLLPPSSALKLSCTVHGPRPLPRSAPYSPTLILSSTVKFAPFATRHRRGYLRDNSERDLGAHLETALRAAMIGERWPKTGVDVVITILEGEEDRWWGDEAAGGAAQVGGWGLMTVLAGCITVSSAAMVDAGIDCVDLVCGGTAAIVRNPVDASGKDSSRRGIRSRSTETRDSRTSRDEMVVLDPNPAEHRELLACCVVGYLPSRDEITLIWMKGNADTSTDILVDSAVTAARATRAVLAGALEEAAAAAAAAQIKAYGS